MSGYAKGSDSNLPLDGSVHLCNAFISVLSKQ